MFAVIVNTLAIMLGTTLGLLLRRGTPQHISYVVMKALGLTGLSLSWFPCAFGLQDFVCKS